jgi:hypothetical protein
LIGGYVDAATRIATNWVVPPMAAAVPRRTVQITDA